MLLNPCLYVQLPFLYLWLLRVLRIAQDVPDRYWYGEKPEILKEFRGQGTDELIDAVNKAANSYPWKTTYKAFPGPNSNTFTAWIAIHVPELDLDLPFSAIGSGYAKKWDGESAK